MGLDHRAATKVQAHVRGHIHRGKYHHFRSNIEGKKEAQAAVKDEDDGGAPFEPEEEDQTDAAVEWMNNIGGAATLVAGAAVASLFEVLRDEESIPTSDDAIWVRLVKVRTIPYIGSTTCKHYI